MWYQRKIYNIQWCKLLHVLIISDELQQNTHSIGVFYRGEKSPSVVIMSLRSILAVVSAKDAVFSAISGTQCLSPASTASRHNSFLCYPKTFISWILVCVSFARHLWLFLPCSTHLWRHCAPDHSFQHLSRTNSCSLFFFILFQAETLMKLNRRLSKQFWKFIFQGTLT